MKKELVRFSEAQPEVDEVSGYSLRRTIYIYAFEVAVALDDTLAGGIVGVWLVLPLTDIAAFVGGYESTYF